MPEWLSWEWFLPATLQQFEWGTAPYEGYYFFVIMLLPALYILRWLIHFRNRQKLEIAMLERDAHDDFWAWLRHIPSVLMLIALSLFMLALARPQRANEQVERTLESIDIILCIDISESMQAEDLRPNRLEAAKEVARKFVAGRTQDKIGIVVFASEAYALSPLTTDHSLLETYLKEIHFDMIPEGGTAIGSALGVATVRMKDSQAKTKIIILLSDGENTAGNIAPEDAAKLAFAEGIRIYTIGVGKEGRIPIGKNVFGETRYIENSMDESTLRKLAEIGEGQYFRAQDNSALSEIFNQIDRYEKVQVKEKRFRDVKDYYQVYLIWGIIFLLLWLLLKNTFIMNALED
ncbi:MAG: VWA domain-containing protein [Cytophagales bacterium]|nr:VWA domain-containing protein [Bernardetiaceae bacterium]MDW8204915.1 VWA domain-containing protein [Cytophagales bacterium]